jgi:hypothetical protein
MNKMDFVGPGLSLQIELLQTDSLGPAIGDWV